MNRLIAVALVSLSCAPPAWSQDVKVKVGDRIIMNGSAQIDTYQSSIGAYGGANIGQDATVATNRTGAQSVVLSGSATIAGDCSVGVGGDANTDITVNAGAAITGVQATLSSSVDLTTPTVPGDMPSSSGHVTYNAGSHVLNTDLHVQKWTFNAGATLTISGDVRVKVTNQFTMNSSHIVVPSGSSLTIYLGKDLTMSGNSTINDDATGVDRFTLLQYVNNKDVTLNTGTICGTMHCGKNLTLSAGAALYGLVTVESQLTVNDSSIHVDQDHAGGLRVLHVVRVDPQNITAQEQLRHTQLAAWGFDVTTIAASDSQANFDAAIAAADVIYVTEEILSSQLGNKLDGATIGIVNGEQVLASGLGFASSYQNYTDDSFTLLNNSHYITQPFALGDLTITDSNQPLLNLSGTVTGDGQKLGERPGSGSSVLHTLMPGDAMYTGGAAPGRRVYLPWGGTNLDFAQINANGRTILKRSLEWTAATTIPPLFIDVSSDTGFDLQSSTDFHSGAGLHWGDLDNDGDLDAIITGNAQSRVLFSIDAGASFFASTIGGGARARQGALFDIDNDGDLDFWHRDEVLYENDGIGGLTDAGNLGFSAPSNNEGVAAGDFDRDGWCDIAMFSQSGNHVGHQTGGTTPAFTVISDGSLGLNDAGDSGNGDFVSTADVNDDGWLDFFHHYYDGKLFLSNADGTWTQNNQGIGIVTSNNEKIGSAFGDFDNDGDMDLWVSRYANGQRGYLWRNDGGVFVDVTVAAGINDLGTQRGCCWGDYDNDGDLDLYLVIDGGDSALYQNQGDGTFVVVDEGVAASGAGHDAVFVDYDNDGDLDLVVTREDTTNVLLENTTDNQAYLLVRVIGAGAGRTDVAAIGTRVELIDPGDGSTLATRHVGVARGYGGAEPIWVHFGGVNPAGLYTVRVSFASGDVDVDVTPASVSTTIGGRTINQMLTVVEADGGIRITGWSETDPND